MSDSLRAALMQVSISAVNAKGSQIEDMINGYTDTSGSSSSSSGSTSGSLSGLGGTSSTSGSDSNVSDSGVMDTSETLELQFEVGNYSTLASAATSIEKSMRDSVKGAIANFA